VKYRYSMLFACLLFAGSAIANDAPASDASIRELLKITDAHKMVDAMKIQIDTMVKASMQQATQGKAITPERQAVLDRMQTKMAAVVDEMLNWDTLEGVYLRTYRASFTQDELDGITAFYKTPAGQAMIKKLPLVMQNVMGEMQSMMKPMQLKIQAIQRESLQELKDLPAKDQPAKDSTPKDPSAS
jgi:uncharacterized protein